MNICKIEECPNKSYVKGFCNSHYLRQHRYNRLHSVKRKYGTGTFSNTGYKLISHNGKRILEHRKVMEDFIGRKLFKYENIHHKNGIKTDNRIENIEIVTYNEHRKYHPFSFKGHKLTQTQKNHLSNIMKKEILNRLRCHITGRFIKINH